MIELQRVIKSSVLCPWLHGCQNLPAEKQHLHHQFISKKCFPMFDSWACFFRTRTGAKPKQWTNKTSINIVALYFVHASGKHRILMLTSTHRVLRCGLSLHQYGGRRITYQQLHGGFEHRLRIFRTAGISNGHSSSACRSWLARRLSIFLGGWTGFQGDSSTNTSRFFQLDGGIMNRESFDQHWIFST